MGALMAVVHKKSADASELIVMMLEALSHRGSDSFGVASPHRATIRETVKELQKECAGSDILIGQNFAKILVRDTPQPVCRADFSLVFEGRVFPPPDDNEGILAAEMLMNFENREDFLIQQLSGDYAFAVARSGEIVVGRDPVGACPLYFGENGDVCAVASERKGLWSIGITRVNHVPPGSLVHLTERGVRFEVAGTLFQPPRRKVDMEGAAQLLTDALLQSIKNRISDVDDVAVAFSGGVDSSLVAFIASLSDANVHLVHVTVEGQKETAFAEQAAKALDLPIHVIPYTREDVAETLPKVLWLIEEPNPLNASIGIPMFWVAEHTAKLGLHVLLTGFGGDELFGGYHRYLEDFLQHGLAGVEKKLYRDVLSFSEMNLPRDNKVCAFHKVEPRMPFIDGDVIQLALSVPAELKITASNDWLRKRVLRYAAKRLGIPKFISEKPKKAIQYATGVSQAMKSLAKKEGLTLRRYVEKSFRETSK